MACLRPYFEPGSQVTAFTLQALPLGRTGGQDRSRGLDAGGCSHIVPAGLMESLGFPFLTCVSITGPGIWLA